MLLIFFYFKKNTKSYSIILVQFFIKYINLYLFFYNYFKILTYLLFKFSYEYIKKVFLKY